MQVNNNRVVVTRDYSIMRKCLHVYCSFAISASDPKPPTESEQIHDSN